MSSLMNVFFHSIHICTDTAVSGTSMVWQFSDYGGIVALL
jgi:hypothetical protein